MDRKKNQIHNGSTVIALYGLSPGCTAYRGVW